MPIPTSSMAPLRVIQCSIHLICVNSIECRPNPKLKEHTDEALSEFVPSERLEIISSSSLCMLSVIFCIAVIFISTLAPDSIYTSFESLNPHEASQRTCLEHFHGMLQPSLAILEQSVQLTLAEKVPEPVPILLYFKICMNLADSSGQSVLTLQASQIYNSKHTL